MSRLRFEPSQGNQIENTACICESTGLRVVYVHESPIAFTHFNRQIGGKRIFVRAAECGFRLYDADLDTLEYWDRYAQGGSSRVKVPTEVKAYRSRLPRNQGAAFFVSTASTVVGNGLGPQEKQQRRQRRARSN
jgi:hypothetical protein